MSFGRVLLGILFLMIIADVMYKTSHPNCSPRAPWYLRAMVHECQAIEKRIAEERQQESDAPYAQ